MNLYPFLSGFLTEDSTIPENVAQRLLSGVSVVRSCTLLNGVITMSFSSTLQVLKINAVESGISKKTGTAWERHTAECMLLDDKNEIECVGRLVIPPIMRESLTVGTFRASFALVVPTYGDAKGDITARLTGLLPMVSGKAGSPSVAPVASSARAAA